MRCGKQDLNRCITTNKHDSSVGYIYLQYIVIKCIYGVYVPVSTHCDIIMLMKMSTANKKTYCMYNYSFSTQLL